MENKDGVILHETFNNLKNAEVKTVDGKQALQLTGKESYVTTGLETAGLGNDLRVKVKEQVLLMMNKFYLNQIMEVSKLYKRYR